jgi:hypothetical protein
MVPAQVTCYLLCGTKVRQVDGYKLKEGPGVTRNILVDCPECGKYVITDHAQQFYFFREGDKVILDEADKRKLSDYVKNNYSRNNPVILSMEVIKAVTGKESVNIRYS